MERATSSARTTDRLGGNLNVSGQSNLNGIDNNGQGIQNSGLIRTGGADVRTQGGDVNTDGGALRTQGGNLNLGGTGNIVGANNGTFSGVVMAASGNFSVLNSTTINNSGNASVGGSLTVTGPSALNGGRNDDHRRGHDRDGFHGGQCPSRQFNHRECRDRQCHDSTRRLARRLRQYGW